MKGPTYIDIYPWVAETQERGYVPMHGTYRIALHLIQQGIRPAYIVKAGENRLSHACSKLRIFLSEHGVFQHVFIFHPHHPNLVNCRAWISLAPEHTSPNLPPGKHLKGEKIALLHDIMALTNRDRNTEMRFIRGAELNNVFCFVSKYTLHRFMDWKATKRMTPKTFIHFPNCHRFTEFPKTTGKLRISNMSLSVGTVHTHKRVPKMFQISRMLNLQHTHVGSHGDEPSVSWADGKYLGQQPDHVIDELMERACYFFCVSDDEGFSMTPMEAIILGVPHILLSEIRAHVEIYGRANVNWTASFERNRPMKRVTEEDRRFFFDTYTPQNMARELLLYLDTK